MRRFAVDSGPHEGKRRLNQIDVPRAAWPKPKKVMRHGEAYHHQNPPELHCGNWPLLRNEEKRPYHD